MPRRSPLDRQIVSIALPALGALVAEPLFLATDTALVGHLGAVPLAGVGIAGVVLHTALGLLVFLAYATTPAVARCLGAGDRRGAIQAGIAGLWLALLIGTALLLVGLPTHGWLVGLFDASAAVTEAAAVFLGVSLWGLPAMLVVLAAAGLLRGLQDTRTPLIVAGIGFAANAALNAWFIYGLGWGVAGSAAGSVVANWGMAAVYLAIAVRAAREAGASLAPGLRGVLSAARSGAWLLLRNAALRVAMIATVAAGAGLGVESLAALQIALTVFATMAYVLDALAIAGQAMIGHALGAADVARAREITSRLLRFGILSGLALGALLAALSPLVPRLFSSDPDVRASVFLLTLLIAAGLPLGGLVFVLDGVLIGAGDARYLALTGVLNIAVYLPLLGLGAAAGLPWLWLAFGLGYLGARAVTLGLRARGNAWLRLDSR